MRFSNTSGPRRTAVVASAALATLIAAATAASAHVTVTPDTAAQGEYRTVSFHVPDEEASAITTSVEVDLPADTPIASVSVRATPGWTIDTTTSPLATPMQTDDGPVTSAVTKIVWSGGTIAPGQFQAFDVSLGPLPTASQIVFKTLQTYSDGSVVRWIDVPRAGQPEPGHPAPVLHLTAPGVSPSATTPSTSTSVATATAVAATADPASSDGTARALGAGGLAVGVLGLATAVFALRRKSTGSRSASSSNSP